MSIRTMGLSASIVIGLAGTANADFNGFGNFLQFRINQGDGGPAPGLGQNPSWIRLTNATDEQARSIFYRTPQDVTQFTASFTYRAVGRTNTATFGACFVVQNSAAQDHAVGGIGFGYGGIERSAAVSLEMGRPFGCFTNVYTNGVITPGASSVAPIDFLSGHDIDVTVSYAGSILQTTFQDRVTGAVYQAMNLIDIQSAIGGNTGYIGITAGTSVWTNGEQYFSDFRYSTVPSPGALG
ncbi:MAG: hypothetical protein AABZ53_08455, partial [Planctomycetota bacterium]